MGRTAAAREARAMERKGNLAARAGRWSAQHRKKAILGWLAFVILAVFIGGSVGTKTLERDDNEIGESGRADTAVADSLPRQESESVLVQSQNGAGNRDPEFRQAVDTVVARLEDTQHVRNVQSPYAGTARATLSEDGKSALVTFELRGDEADDKVDPALATVAQARQRADRLPSRGVRRRRARTRR